jgi:2-phospho-L-lactate guanylyltransferase
MTIWAIVPIKPLRYGKSRLSGILSVDQRTQLNRHLLMHTLSTLAELPEIDHILVISRDPAALAIARNQGARTLLEEGTPQLNTALNRATALAKAHKAHSVLVLPADLPLISPRDIRNLLKRGKEEPVVVVVPDRREDGTNGLLMNPAGVIEYGFGPGSFQRHCERARKAGANLEILASPTLGLDLDLPEDLELVNGLEGLGIRP